MKGLFEPESRITKLPVYCYESRVSQKREQNRVLKCMVNKYDAKTRTSTIPLFLTVFTTKDTYFGELDKDELAKKKLFVSGRFVVDEREMSNGEKRLDIKIFADTVRER